MAVLIQSSTKLPLPSRVAAPSRPDSTGLWLLTVALFLLLIVGRVAGYTPTQHAVKKRPTSNLILPPQSFQLPVTQGTVRAIPGPVKPQAAAFATAAH